MLGRDLILRLEDEGEDAMGYGRGELDITDASAVHATLRRRQPAIVVNCAAWTAVDDAESHEDAALRVNGHAVTGLAAACADLGITLVQVSTSPGKGDDDRCLPAPGGAALLQRARS
jgi:dTDP-4-dehydrorhamnose reductase